MFRARLHMRPKSTLASKPTLPRLPIPELRKTLDKYVKSLQPLMLEDERKGVRSYQDAHASVMSLVDQFADGVGKVCQQRLLDLDKVSPQNWLDDNFWIKCAYHQWRSPLPVNSNWWLAFHNDNSIPVEVLKDTPRTITLWQTRRAAWLVYMMLDFKTRVDSQELYPDTTRTGIWLRDNTAKMFNTCRIPQKGCDSLAPRASPQDLGSRKLLLMIHDWCYSVVLYTSDGVLLDASIIEAQLTDAVADAKTRLQNGETAYPIGILTADDRDLWASNYAHLLSLSPQNKTTMQTIHHSSLALSLDDYTGTSEEPFSLNTPAEVDSHLRNIRSSPNAHNRWFDKPFTLIVESNSRAGAMGEHSPVDALVPSIIAEYAIIRGIDATEFPSPNPSTASLGAQAGGWERLDWVVDDHIQAQCKLAEDRAKTLIASSDASVMWFEEYGTDWIKSVAKLTPDAYLQMVLQLAWYKTRGCFTATYETALTRVFDQGRTETIRTLTSDSRAFVLAMSDLTTSNTSRKGLLKRAVQTHTSLTREAATGRGIDRHLLGLQLMLKTGDDLAFFREPLFSRSQEWKLSTSGLSAGHQFRGTGFGSAYEDGYGISYMAAPEMVKFGIETKHTDTVTSTAVFKQAIVDSMREMREVSSAEEIMAHL